MYIVTRHEDLKTASRHPEIFSSRLPNIDPIPVPVPPLDLDLPLHRDFRSFLNPFFSKSYIERFRAQIEEMADGLIDSFIDTGEVEFVGQYAVPFTSSSLALAVLDDDNLSRLADGVDAITRISHGDPQANVDLADIASEVLAERRAATAPRDDVMQALINVTVDGGRPLTETEQLGVVTVLLLGGLETTNQAISEIGRFLAERDDIETRMREPDWVKADMEEFLRITSTVAVLGREVTQDTEILGCPMKAGDRVALYWMSGNRDTTMYERPDELVFDRSRKSHLAFGDGIHRCVGQHFARMQIGIAFDRLLARAGNFRIKPGIEVREVGKPGRIAVEELHLTFDKS
ncbi:cytochrome P450 [Streptomyces sp. NPDC001984]